MTSYDASRLHGVNSHLDAIAWVLDELSAGDELSRTGPSASRPAWMAALTAFDDLELAEMCMALVLTLADVIRLSETAHQTRGLRPSPRLLMLTLFDRLGFERSRLEGLRAANSSAASPTSAGQCPAPRQRVGQSLAATRVFGMTLREIWRRS